MGSVKPIRMTEDEYQTMLDSQNGRCLLCGKRQIKQRLTRDHDHVTGRIRGLLCLRCNRALGPFEYSEDLLWRLRRYITTILADRLLYHEGLAPYDTREDIP